MLDDLDPCCCSPSVLIALQAHANSRVGCASRHPAGLASDRALGQCEKRSVPENRAAGMFPAAVQAPERDRIACAALKSSQSHKCENAKAR